MPRGKKHNPATSLQRQDQTEESNIATAQETGPALSAELLPLRSLLVQDMKEMVETTIGNALESFKTSLETSHGAGDGAQQLQRQGGDAGGALREACCRKQDPALPGGGG